MDIASLELMWIRGEPVQHNISLSFRLLGTLDYVSDVGM
jgi:hypothetical protein